MLRTIKVKQGNVTKLVTGLEGYGIGGQGRILGVKVIRPATFRGKHNRSKSVCLVLLANSMLARMQGGVLSAKQLSELSGLSYGSVLASLSKWYGWHLVKRGTYTPAKGQSLYVYSISEKGKQWLARHKLHMASQLQAYDTELRRLRGYGFTEALVETPELSAPYARTLTT